MNITLNQVLVSLSTPTAYTRSKKCNRFLPMVSEEAVCFNHQIKKCKGICANEEEIELYNQRADKILQEYSFKEDCFMLINKGRNIEEKSVVLVENRKYVGYGYIDQATQANSIEEIRDIVRGKTYYPDMNDLIRGWLKNKTPFKTIVLNKRT